MIYKRVIIRKFGPPDVLEVIEEPHLPEPKLGEIRVRVQATSAAYTDTMIRKGAYYDVKEIPPFSLGYDMVGVVDKLGEGTNKFKPGDRVCDLTVIGSYSEYLCVPENRLIPVPKSVMTEIENYLSVRKSLMPHDQNPYLLAGKNQNPIKAEQVRYAFHKAIKQIGLDHPRRLMGNVNFSQPTPHSLRHSFAVNTLIKIKERGQSPQHALPVLAAYMGHSEYNYTSVYLRVADALSRKNLVDFNLWQKRKE